MYYLWYMFERQTNSNKKINNMTQIETLASFAKEINKDWTSEYSALIQDGELRVKHNNLIVALVDQKFDIEMVEDDFDEVEDQLRYMIER